MLWLVVLVCGGGGGGVTIDDVRQLDTSASRVMVSYKHVSIIDQDILQIIKHCLVLGERELYL